MIAGTEARPLVYEQLPDATRYIRLLQFEPSPDESIRCRMTAHQLDDAPPYAALSYTWGEPMPAQQILVNASLFHCRPNCHYVLWQVRRFMSLVKHSTSANREPLLRLSRRRLMLENVEPYSYIWIDSICVNQDDLSERVCQVLQMGKIYKKARQVLTGLGEDDESSRTLAALLEQPLSKATPLGTEAQICSADEGSVRFDTEAQLNPLSAEDPRRTHLENLTHHVVAFGKRPYWTRVWIVQELWFADHFVLLCGPSAFDGPQLLSLFGMLGATETHGLVSCEPLENMRRIVAISRSPLHVLWTFLRTRKRTTSNTIYLLTKFDQWRCSNPLDRVYGFSSLIWSKSNVPVMLSGSGQTSAMLQRRMEPIYPDYSRSLLQLAYVVISCADRMSPNDSLRSAQTLLRCLRLDASHADVAKLIDQRRQDLGKHHATDMRSTQVRKHLLPDIGAKGGLAQAWWSPDHEAAALFYAFMPGARLVSCEGDGFAFPERMECDIADVSYDSIRYPGEEVPIAGELLEISLSKEAEGARFFWYQKEAIGLVCPGAKSGDYLVLTELQTSSKFSIWLVLRRQMVCYEIIGQALMLPGWDSDGYSLPSDDGLTAGFGLWLRLEDLIVLLLQSALLFDDFMKKAEVECCSPGDQSEHAPWEQGCHATRLGNRFTGTRFSSFAMLEKHE